jgi:hypothetical protein
VYERFGLTLVDTVAIPGTDRNVWFLRKGLEAGLKNKGSSVAVPLRKLDMAPIVVQNV